MKWPILILVSLATIFVGVVFYEGSVCACPKIDGVARLNALNPLRDRRPEAAAEQFLKKLAAGKCVAAEVSQACGETATSGAIHDWYLVGREHDGSQVVLYYYLKDRRLPDADHDVGKVYVEERKAGWTVVDYRSN